MKKIDLDFCSSSTPKFSPVKFAEELIAHNGKESILSKLMTTSFSPHLGQ